jgi:uncharacterized protein (TIGR03792 family)
MVIELLRVTCPPEKHAAFIQRDAEVWTRGLAQHLGFMGKEVWVSPDHPSQVTLVIRWASMAHWKSFPAEWSQRQDEQMGDLLMPLTCEAYEVIGVSPDVVHSHSGEIQ